MKLLLIVFVLVLLLVPSVSALEIWAEFSGPAIWDAGTKIQFNERFYITIWAENTASDPTRFGWSSPFRLSGTGDVTTLAYQDVIFPIEFLNIWNWGYWIEYESWDGDLTTPDQFSIGGTGSGWPPESGPIKVAEIELEIYAATSINGQFCIDSGNFLNNTYDWLFEPPSPDFDKICLDVMYCECICGELNNDILVNIFDVTYLIQYLYEDGPEPFLMNLADVNNDCSINIFDITYLISYLYRDGPSPICPSVFPCK